MKITHGYDHNHVVGEIFLSREIIDAVASGHRFELVVEYRGIEPVGVSLMPLMSQTSIALNPEVKTDIPNKIDPTNSKTWRCKECDTGYNGHGWWKCCPQHTNQHVPVDVICNDCVYELHPDYKH